MKESVMGVVGSIVVSMIHKEMFRDCKTPKERLDEITEAIKRVEKAFD